MPLQEKKFVESRFIKPETVESRSYQVKLAESVLNGGNSLVVAPTALGKTIVAVLVASAIIEKEPGKKILFLAPTKPLCEQHMKTMQKLMTLEPESTILLTGSLASKKRAVQWEKASIIIATPQTIENDLSNGRISLNEVSLIIFDEAHRAMGEYAYVYIAKKFKGRGLVLALTASPGSQEAHIKEVCTNLGIKNIEIKGLEDQDVAPYSHDINVEWRTVELPEEFKTMKRLTEHFMQRQADILCKFGLSRTNSLRAFGKGRLIEMQNALHRRIAAARGKNPSLFSAASAAAALMKASHAHTLLETQGVNALQSYLEREKNKEGKVSRATSLFLSSMEMVQVEELAKELCEKGVIHPKFGALSEVLQQQFALRPESSAIVFNHYRDSIKRLSEELNKIPGIRAERFVGQAAKGKEKGMSQKEQAEKIQMLKEGKINCIVASSVHPDEFIIVRNDAENKIEIKKIGEFADSFIPFEPAKSEVAKVTGYSALSFDGTKTDFRSLTQVHKHPRQSEVVDVVFSSGFRAKVTRDHSFFTFDRNSNLVPCPPKQGMFAKVCLSAPNFEEPKTLDLAKEFYQKLPVEFREKIFCSIAGLTQPKMRVLSSDRRFLETLTKEPPKQAGRVTNESGLDAKTVGLVAQRLDSSSFILIKRTGRLKIISITERGREYLLFLNWFFENCRYYKGKYRLPLESVADSNLKLENFCKIFIEACYGKIKLPRFLEVNPALAELLGLYVAEGNARNTVSTAGIHLAAQKKEMQQRMANCVRKGLGIEPSITWCGVDINSKLAYYLIKYVFCAGIGSYNKEVPSIIFTLPTEHKWRFFEGYSRGDGHITGKRIVLTTVSRKLVTGLIFLLRQLGVKKISLQKSRKRSTFEVNVMESVPFQEVNVNGKKCYYDVFPVAQCNGQTFSLMENTFCSSNNGHKTRQRGAITEQNCFDYIKKIIPLEKQPEFVYDVSVEKTQLFVGGQGLVCLHNSVAEEGLDIPSVDLVVFYEPVPSEIRLIQRRGRTGRLAAGRVVILMAKNTRDEAYYWTSINKEKKMHRILHRMKKSGEETAESGNSTGENGGNNEPLQARAEKTSGNNEPLQARAEKTSGNNEPLQARAEKTSGNNEPLQARAEKTSGNNEPLQARAEKTSGGNEPPQASHEREAGREKQTTLHSFDSENAGKIVVYVDVRERDSGVAKMLEELGCVIVEKQLEVGDYVPGKEIAVERKSVSDFLSSIVDGRLGKQLINMAESYEKSLVIVEGDKEKLFETNIHRNAIIGMLTSIALNYRVPLLFTDSARETAQYIFVIAKREQEGRNSDVRLRIGRKGLTLGEQQRFVVESLPLIGPKMARSLLKKFGSVKGIVNAQSKELQEVDNLGQKKAKLVRQVLLSEYKEEE